MTKRRIRDPLATACAAIRLDWDEETLWRTYVTLELDIEAVVPLAQIANVVPAPHLPSQAHPCAEGHLFITVIAVPARPGDSPM